MKKYEFNNESFMDLINELYPTKGSLINLEIDYECFNEENLNKVINEVKRIIENPIIKDEVDTEVKKEKINIFGQETNSKLNEIFSNDDLLFFGHGGAAKEIIEGEFRCRYANIQSHFLQLECSNESLSNLKEWPHLNSKTIAIMALNRHEYNPLYNVREKRNDYDTDIYSIPNEYFVGYYDRNTDEFILNPNFKERHDFNPDSELYQDENINEGFTIIDGPKLIQDYYKKMELIDRIMYFASLKANLDEIGYKKVCQKILNEVNVLQKLQEQITPEFIEEQIKKEKIIETQDDDTKIDDEDWVDSWEDDWGDSFPPLPKTM